MMFFIIFFLSSSLDNLSSMGTIHLFDHENARGDNEIVQSQKKNMKQQPAHRFEIYNLDTSNTTFCCLWVKYRERW